MRALIISSLLFMAALAAPPTELVHPGLNSAGQTVLSGTGNLRTPSDSLSQDIWVEGGNEFVRQQGIIYQRTSSSALSDAYQLRVKANSSTLCDNTVKQHSGYLDIDEKKHLFFWFFESRNSPSTSPLVLWLNGGPGCSSSTGLLFELGPCRIVKGGETTVLHNYSWTQHANIIFLDQPVNVGYSYSTGGPAVDTTPLAAVDVWSFLELFLLKFPEYSKLPFHIAAESYGGTYGPNIASVIHKKNLELARGADSTLKHINLASLILGNGLTDPLTQFASVPEYACEGPYALYEDPEGPECQSLRSKVPTCERLIKTCYDWNSRLICIPAGLYCWSQIYGPLMQLKRNPYDVRQPCDPQVNGSLCYEELNWIDNYLNKPEVKQELGAQSDIKFVGCSNNVNIAFKLQGDDMHNSAKLLPPLLASGIRLLVYAGRADLMCNFIGNEAWMHKLENPFQKEFNNASSTPWVTLDSGKVAGRVRTAGGGGFGAGSYTFVAVNKAGHMVPFDQPEAALDLFSRWITNTPLTFSPNTPADEV